MSTTDHPRLPTTRGSAMMGTRPTTTRKLDLTMANTFDAAPDVPQERSSAFLAIEEPGEKLEQIIDEAQLHRGSLREQDGYTVPFREGGAVRIRIVDEPESGLRFEVHAPTEERRQHIEDTIAEQVEAASHIDADSLDWEHQGRS